MHLCYAEAEHPFAADDSTARVPLLMPRAHLR